MKCGACGNDIKQGEQFCSNCGAPVTANTAQPQTQVQPAMVPDASAAPAPPPMPVVTPAQSPAAPTAPTGFGAQPAAVPALQQQNVPAQPQAGYQPVQPGAVAPVAGSSDGRGKAIAALVLGVLGCIAWLIPIIGLVFGVLALVFGTTSFHSTKRKLAIAGTVLGAITIALSIFGFVLNVQEKKTSTGDFSQTTTKTTSNTANTTIATKPLSTPCYDVDVPEAATVTQTEGSCTVKVMNLIRGEVVMIKVVNNNAITASSLSRAAQDDITDALKSVSGGTITSQSSVSFSGSPAYHFAFSASDASVGVVDYVYKKTSQGNIVIVFHSTRESSKLNDFNIESTWEWK